MSHRTIFFSWQSDTPTQIGRHFLRGVLEQACKEILADTSIDEAPRNELRVDSDTQGEAGQPPITETILKKIDESALVVADMTFTGKRIDGRPTPNANVLIEYGWALKSLSYQRIISIMNEAYGEASRESLPFDLAYTRWPTRFTLKENASTKEKAEVKRKLVNDFKIAIRASLATVPKPPLQPPPRFPRATAKDGPARFRKVGEELGFYEDFNNKAWKVFLKRIDGRPGPDMWLRLMPSVPPGKTWKSYELKKIAQSNGELRLFPLIYGSGLDWFRAEDGWGVYSPEEKGDANIETSGVAFVFETGEIWAVDTALLTYNTEKLFYTEIENKYVKSLIDYGQFLQMLKIKPPYQWVAGLTGIKGRSLGYPPPPGHSWFHEAGPVCLTDQIEVEGEYNGKESALVALLPFFNKIFEKCGRQRPDYLKTE